MEKSEKYRYFLDGKNIYLDTTLIFYIDIFFLFFHENICCGYSLEASHWGASNEYPQHILLGRNKKNINTSWLQKDLPGAINMFYLVLLYIFTHLAFCHWALILFGTCPGRQITVWGRVQWVGVFSYPCWPRFTVFYLIHGGRWQLLRK